MVTLKGFLPSEPDRRMVGWLCDQGEGAAGECWKAVLVYRLRVPEPGMMVRGEGVGERWSLTLTATVRRSQRQVA